MTLGYKFNQKIDNLPKSLTHLYFGFFSDFNHPINNLHELKSLTHLEFHNYGNFNQPLENLPEGLKNLTLPKSYDKPLDKVSYNVKITRI